MGFMKNYLTCSLVFFCTLLTTNANAARFVFNNGGLGCGTIVSMRETTQESLPSELRSEYGGARTSGGQVGQIISNVPGIGILGAVAGEVIGSVMISSVSTAMNEADRKKQIETATFKNVQAIEFLFDDGEIINIPVYVVSGMRYKVGTRLNAMISPGYGNIALGANALFAAMPEKGDSDYDKKCRVDDESLRHVTFNSLRDLIDESRIVNVNERRLNASPATPVVVDAVQK
jgi:hypothetical protein